MKSEPPDPQKLREIYESCERPKLLIFNPPPPAELNEEQEIASLHITGFPAMISGRRKSLIKWLESTVKLLKEKPEQVSDEFSASYKILWEE